MGNIINERLWENGTGSQEFVVVRHLRRMFGEGHPYVCEYMEEVVESKRCLETREKSGCGEMHGLILEWKQWG